MLEPKAAEPTFLQVRRYRDGKILSRTDDFNVERVESLPEQLAEPGRNVAYDPRTETLYLSESVDDDVALGVMLMVGSELEL